MKYFYLCLFLLLVGTSCSTEYEEDEFFEPDIIMKDVNGMLDIDIPFAPTDSMLTDSLNTASSRGWDEKNTLTELFLVAGSSQPMKLSMSSDWNGDRTISFKLYVDRNGAIHAKNAWDEDILLTGSKGANPIPCILVNTSSPEVSLSTATDITTPGGKSVKIPYGDLLFKSNPFTFSYKVEKHLVALGRREDKYIYSISYEGEEDNYAKVYTNKFVVGSFRGFKYKDIFPLTFDVKRMTTVIIPNVVITNYKEEFEDDDFEDELGTDIKYWKVQAFLSRGHDLYNISSGTSSGQAIVALTKAPVTFREGQEFWDSRRKKTLEGIGVIFKESEKGKDAFVFPQKSLQDGKLVFSFYYTGKSSKYRKYNSMEIPSSDLRDLELVPNVENIVTIAFHVSDFINHMKKPRKRSYGVLDPDFGPMMDIPYTLSVEAKDR